MAAVKAHLTFGFWKAKLLSDRGFPEAGDTPVAMGRITSVADLPDADRFEKMIKAAVALNEQGIALKRPKSQPKAPVRPPAYLLAALKKNKRALANYEAFSPSHKREYVEWITEAKTNETRDRRLAQAVEWLAAGKSRNWKYERA